MEVSYFRINDYTLVENNEQELSEDSERYGTFSKFSSITRTFNFLAGQVTTKCRDEIRYLPNSFDGGGAASVATQLHIQNFTDLPTLAEVRYMHRKLQQLEGNPPPLEEALSDNMGKPKYGALERKP